MSEPGFLDDVYLPELGIGAGTAIWGFRGCALGHSKCCCLVQGFERIFGPDDGGPMLGDMLKLAQCLGNSGNRKIKLAMPGCARISHDEASLLSAFESAQAFDPVLRDAHLHWLFAKAVPEQAGRLVERLASGFQRHGLDIEAPRRPVGRPQKAVNLASVSTIGSA